MEFDKSKVYTSLNADKLKIGSEVYVADTLECLMFQVAHKITPSKRHSQSRYYNKGKIVRIEQSDCTNRFQIDTNPCRRFNLAYLISEPIENIDNIKDECKFAVPRHYIEEYAHMLGKTYWELLDEIQRRINENTI